MDFPGTYPELFRKAVGSVKHYVGIGDGRSQYLYQVRKALKKGRVVYVDPDEYNIFFHRMYPWTVKQFGYGLFDEPDEDFQINPPFGDKIRELRKGIDFVESSILDPELDSILGDFDGPVLFHYANVDRELAKEERVPALQRVFDKLRPGDKALLLLEDKGPGSGFVKAKESEGFRVLEKGGDKWLGKKWFLVERRGP